MVLADANPCHDALDAGVDPCSTPNARLDTEGADAPDASSLASFEPSLLGPTHTAP